MDTANTAAAAPVVRSDSTTTFVKTLEDGTVTVRERDSMTQLRVPAFAFGAATTKPQPAELLGLLHDSIHSEA